MEIILKKNSLSSPRKRGSILFILFLLVGCGSSSENVSGENTPAATGTSSSADSQSLSLSIFRKGDSFSREILAGVYPGDSVDLEVKGGLPNRPAVWTSSNTSLGIISDEGELTLIAAGEFSVRVQVTDSFQTLQVRVGEERPYMGEEPPPVPTPSAEPTPSPTPSASPSASTTPSPSPSPEGEPPPDPVPSDHYMDEVTSFEPGAHAGFGADQFPNIVLGPPQGSGSGLGGFHVLSLGVGGEIVLKSVTPILNGGGFDFIVFENAFYAGGNPNNPFAEPGEVAVSQDGSQFFSFPCAKTDAPFFPGCAGVHPVYANPLTNSIDPTDPATAGGDAFDLEALGLEWAQYVRVRDLSSGGGGNSAGFDLDAISIIHQ